jgi:hypothetical protein
MKTQAWVGDNIKLNLRQIKCDFVEWIQPAYHRNWLQAIVNTGVAFRLNKWKVIY